MKNRIGVIVLVLLCLGLGIGLLATRKQASDQQQQDTERIETLSNKWVKTSSDLEEQKQVAAMYEKDLDGQKKALGELTNNFSRISADLAQTSAKLVSTEAALQTNQAELAKRDVRISELENQTQDLNKQASDLTNQLSQKCPTIRFVALGLCEGDRVSPVKGRPASRQQQTSPAIQ